MYDVSHKMKIYNEMRKIEKVERCEKCQTNISEVKKKIYIYIYIEKITDIEKITGKQNIVNLFINRG